MAVKALFRAEDLERIQSVLDDVFDGGDALPGFTCVVRDFFPPQYD